MLVTALGTYFMGKKGIPRSSYTMGLDSVKVSTFYELVVLDTAYRIRISSTESEALVSGDVSVSCGTVANERSDYKFD